MEILTSGSALQSSRHQRTEWGRETGRDAGWWNGDTGGRASEPDVVLDGTWDAESLGASE